MWTFEQSTGRLRRGNIAFVGGYAGFGLGKNNPALQDQRNVGPLPRGHYLIGGPEDTPQHGPYVLRLYPMPGNQMFGRAGFLCHGASASHPLESSNGCIIEPRHIRETVWTSGDTVLEVVA